jgi:hypothetical protein
MASHKYTVGQTVLITRGQFVGSFSVASRSRIPGLKEGEQFQIVRRLPEEDRTPQYRIKNELDGHERNIREDQLDAVR